jgi:hypothetical protein
MQVRQVPLRQELGQSMPPCSSDTSNGCWGQASHCVPSSPTRAMKKGRGAGAFMSVKGKNRLQRSSIKRWQL